MPSEISDSQLRRCASSMAVVASSASSASRSVPPSQYSRTRPRYDESVVTTPNTCTMRGLRSFTMMASSVAKSFITLFRFVAVKPKSAILFSDDFALVCSLVHIALRALRERLRFLRLQLDLQLLERPLLVLARQRAAPQLRVLRRHHFLHFVERLLLMRVLVDDGADVLGDPVQLEPERRELSTARRRCPSRCRT